MFCLLKGNPPPPPQKQWDFPDLEATLPLLFMWLEAAARLFCFFGFFCFLATTAHCSSVHSSQEKQATARLGGSCPWCSHDASAPSLHRASGQRTGTGRQRASSRPGTVLDPLHTASPSILRTALWKREAEAWRAARKGHLRSCTSVRPPVCLPSAPF